MSFARIRRVGMLAAVALSMGCGSDTTAVLPEGLSVTTTTLPAASEGSAYSATLEASGGNPPYTWLRSQGVLPGGIGLDQAAGVLAGTPTEGGDFVFVARVSDANGHTGESELSLHVIALPPLEIMPFDPLVATVGAPFSAQFAATGRAPPYVWHSTSLALGAAYQLPPELTLDTDGHLAGVPAYPAGTYQFGLEVSVFGGPRTTIPVELVVQSPSGLRVETTAIPDMHQGSAYSTTLTASGGSGPYSFSTWQRLPPDGITIAADGQLSGVATATTFTATAVDTLGVLVTDAVGATAFATVAFNYIAEPVGIPDAVFPEGVVGTYYEVFLGHTGPMDSDVWSVSGGTLPDGITLVGNGAISGHMGARLLGLPTKVGAFSFQLMVTSQGQSATRDFTITIQPTPLSITTAALPHATAGDAYQVFLVGSGGTAPYVWSVASGSLPAGVILSPTGELGGTPTSGGTFSFSVRVDDASPAGFEQTATTALSLIVDP